jgi:hypothetical protein
MEDHGANMKFKVVYPEEHYMTEERIRTYAADLIADDIIDGPLDEDVYELIHQIEDTGRIAFELPHYVQRKYPHET